MKLRFGEDIKPGNILIEMNENEPVALHAPPTDRAEPTDFYMASEPLPMNSDPSNIGVFLADFGTGKLAQ